MTRSGVILPRCFFSPCSFPSPTGCIPSPFAPTESPVGESHPVRSGCLVPLMSAGPSGQETNQTNTPTSKLSDLINLHRFSPSTCTVHTNYNVLRPTEHRGISYLSNLLTCSLLWSHDVIFFVASDYWLHIEVL